MPVPNIGDLLMLSQVSWKVSRAFAADQNDAPIEFKEVESEISHLAKALKQLAEILHDEVENSLIQEAGEDIQHDIATVLESCKRVVHELETLVDHNQVIKKHRTVGGFAIERAWSSSVLVEHATMSWTVNGGDLHDLRDILELHKGFITLLSRALQR
jgi:hypothetical protein